MVTSRWPVSQRTRERGVASSGSIRPARSSECGMSIAEMENPAVRRPSIIIVVAKKESLIVPVWS